MKKLLKLSALAVLVSAAAFAFTSVSPATSYAQDNDDNSEQAAQTEDNQQQGQSNPYSYTAQPGDSYAKIARKAVQTYGFNKSVNLSQAQIIAAETFLTSEADFPSISAGQEINLSEDSIKAAIEKAQGLDEAAIARWEKYVPGVDFNTNNVGESQQ